jgi:hypothetical protein
MLSALLILQAREKKGQTPVGVVYRDGKMLPPPTGPDFDFGQGSARDALEGTPGSMYHSVSGEITRRVSFESSARSTKFARNVSIGGHCAVSHGVDW